MHLVRQWFFVMLAVGFAMLAAFFIVMGIWESIKILVIATWMAIKAGFFFCCGGLMIFFATAMTKKRYGGSLRATQKITPIYVGKWENVNAYRVVGDAEVDRNEP